MSKTDEIRNEIIEMIRLGIIGPGEKLPSIRKTAIKHDVSITPVSDAYNTLVAQQLVESRPQSGYFVTSSIDKLHELAAFLLEKETITGEEFMAILNKENNNT